MRDGKKITFLITLWAIRIGMTLWITLMFFHAPGVDNFELYRFNNAISDAAHKPFVGRVLAPWLIRKTVNATPVCIKNLLHDNRVVHLFQQKRYVRDEMKWRGDILPWLTAFFLSAGCLMAFSLLAEKFWQYFFASKNCYAKGFSLVALLCLPPLFRYASYLYDFPTLLLYSFGLYLMVQQRWLWYWPAFLMACLSKETAILLAVVFAFYFRAGRFYQPWRYWGSIGVHMLVAGACRVALFWAYYDNPGNWLDFHLFGHNLRLLTTPYSLESALAWLVLAALLLHRWNEKPCFLRIATGMLIPLLVLCLFFGYLDELRDYYEVYLPALSLITFSFLRLLGYPVAVRPLERPMRIGGTKPSPQGA